MKTNLLFLVLGLPFIGCGNGSVMSSADAQRAYVGMSASIDKAIQLGFDGFNQARSANISPQTGNGVMTGTLTVTGQVDQGASANKGMRLQAAYAKYSDDGKITYDSDAAAVPLLNMSLKNIPTGTLDGTFDGSLTMTGALKNKITLAITFSATLQAGMGTTVARKPGTTHVTGTATSDYGVYNIDVTQ